MLGGVRSGVVEQVAHGSGRRILPWSLVCDIDLGHEFRTPLILQPHLAFAPLVVGA
jgi:hypothetical protein